MKKDFTSSEFIDETDAMRIVLEALSPLNPETQSNVLNYVVKRLNISSTHITSSNSDSPSSIQNTLKNVVPNDIQKTDTPSIKKFYSDKKPNNGIEQIACFAYYLTHYKNIPEFKTRDLTKLIEEAGRSLSNTSTYVENAKTKGYLISVSKGRKKISALGEEVVHALPNREKLQEVLSVSRVRRKKKSKSKLGKK